MSTFTKGRALPNGKTPPRRSPRWGAPAICLALAGMTFAVFGQTLRHPFINFDDNEYVYDNPVVARGLTGEGMVWAFTQFHAANWHPLTWLSHMLDCQFYGLSPGGHHLSNVLLHTATVILLFLGLRRITGALWRSAFVAAVFAIHPLRVESVAWVAERKDVLSGLFFMLTVGAYVRYVGECKMQSGKRKIFYVLALVLFILGLMCKPMLVTLPLVLLLLDYWPLRRAESARRLVMEKLPLLALSAASCATTFLAQKGAIQSFASCPLADRLDNALASAAIYLGQMVYPVNLALPYPLPRNGPAAWEVVLAGTLLAGFSALAWAGRRTRPWLPAGWAWYLVMLLPVAGIIQVGAQAHADRYTYLPQIGIYVAVTWLVAEWRLNVAALVSLATGVLGALMVCAWHQTAYWQDSETLWSHTLACTKANDVAHNNLGLVMAEKGRDKEAAAQYQEALQISPRYAQAQYNLGNAFLEMGSTDEAVTHYTMALQINPQYAKAHGNLGLALGEKGMVDEAITQFQLALESSPRDAAAHNNLGNALRQEGKVDEAISQYRIALQINPAYAEAHSNLGNALRQKGMLDEAIPQYQKALQIRPAYAEARYNLGNALGEKGMVDEAISQYQMALQINPNYPEARHSLGFALAQKGRPAEAITQYQEALRMEPANAQVQISLAWLLATCADASLRNGGKAVELAQQADALSGGANPFILDTLAAAFAEAGRFSDAERTAQKALDLARAAGQPDLVRKLNAELKLYESGLPCRQ
jgi:tetratricopeptide (TPR) repeat protein